MSAKKEIKKRLTIVFIIFTISMLLVVAKIISLQFVHNDQWEQTLSKYQSDEIEIAAERGNILDCNNKHLASSIPSYEIYMDMKAGGLTEKLFNNNIDSLSICLSKLIGDKSSTQYKHNLKEAYRKGHRYYKITRKRLNYNQHKEIKQLPLFRLGQNTSGLICERFDQRKLPFGILAARTIGSYSTHEKRGIVGIENAFNEDLQGTPGSRIKKKVSSSWVSINIHEPTPGKDIKTTLDIKIQDIVETALIKQMEAYQPEFGTAIVMEVKTGDIKAIANLGRTKSGGYWEKYNYAVGERMEPGSTFKLASLMVALEDGVVKLTDTIDTGNGTYKFYNSTLKDSKKGGYGKITVKEVFEHSSNIGVTKIINKNYKANPEKFIDRLYAMGLNEKLNLGIKGEREPYIKYPGASSWSGISLPWISMGYEVSLLPLHTLTFYNAVANDGKMVRPRLVSHIMDQGEIIKEFKPEIINPSICSSTTIAQAQELLKGVVENGTATNLNKTHLKIAGKTGTARVANKNQGYKNQDSHYKYRASFCGYFPADEPLYSCIVLVDSPSKKGIYGNVVAGTVFREIADKIYAQTYDLPEEYSETAEKTEYTVPVSLDGNKEELVEVFKHLNTTVENTDIKDEWVETYNKNDHIEIKGHRLVSDVMPNVRGMGAKDAIFLLENKGLKVSITGCGTVKQQSIPQGSKIRKNNKVSLILK